MREEGHTLSHALPQLQQTPRLVTSPDELETLEREIRQRVVF